VLPNEVLRDCELSYRARGVLAYLLSHPPDWSTSSDRIAAQGREGRDAIRTALRELHDAGYLQLVREQDQYGYWSTDYLVTDNPWHFPQPVDNPVDNLLTEA